MNIHPAAPPLTPAQGNHPHASKTPVAVETGALLETEAGSRAEISNSKASVSVTLSVSYSHSTTYTSAPAAIYHMPSPVQTHEVSGPALVASVGERTAAASTILAFIEQRLAFDASDGATKEELQSRLEAGLEGFVQGYTEAFEQISAMGVLTPEVQAAIEKTYSDVMAGIAELAEHYQLENPAPEVVVEPTTLMENTNNHSGIISSLNSGDTIMNTLNANPEVENLKTMLEPSQSFYQTLDAQTEKSREYSFKLTTADGDTVTIHAYANSSERYQYSNVDAENGRFNAHYAASSSQDFSFSVEGDLDAGELKAINDLLSQINEIADSFFTGDIMAAYEQALSVGYDSDEIVSFSLNLTQIQTTRIETTYGQIAQAGDEGLLTHDLHTLTRDNLVERIREFIQQLEDMRLNSQTLGLGGEKLAQLTQFVGDRHFGQHPDFDKFGPFMDSMMGALEKLKA